mgnify:CR=1 FL=1
MPLYVYKAADAKGKLVKGELEAASEIEVTTHLAKIGYLPINISIRYKTEKAKPGSEGAVKKAGKASARSIIIFSRQFSTIIKAGIPIVEGLTVLSEQTEDIALKYALQQIVNEVKGGISLSQAMTRHPNVFNELYVNTIVAGESAGVLEVVLTKLSHMLEDEFETRNKIQEALRYPIMVMIALCIAVIVLSIFVVPQFAKIYIDSKVALPLPTQIMIMVSTIMKNYWFILIPAAVGGFFLFRHFISTTQGRFWWDGLKFKLMIVGEIYTKITMQRFTSMLSVLYQAGLPVLKTMDIVGMTIGNVVLSKEIGKMKQALSDGKGISTAVLDSKFFPRIVGFMISVGEKSGSLPAMLDSVCEYFSMEVKSAVKDLASLIEPIMTAVLGIVVMTMCLAIFLPLWGMISVMKGSG